MPGRRRLHHCGSDHQHGCAIRGHHVHGGFPDLPRHDGENEQQRKSADRLMIDLWAVLRLHHRARVGQQHAPAPARKARSRAGFHQCHLQLRVHLRQLPVPQLGQAAVHGRLHPQLCHGSAGHFRRFRAADNASQAEQEAR